MVNAYPLIYKKLVIGYYNKSKNITVKETTDLFNISKSSLFGWLKDNKLGVLRNKNKYKRSTKITPEIRTYICNKVIGSINFNIIDLCYDITNKYSITIGHSTIYKILKENNITHKKVNKRFIFKDKQKHENEKETFKKHIENHNSNDIISIDETHFDSFISTNYGWSKKGDKIKRTRFIKKKQRFTLICAINKNKILHKKLIKGSANGDNFNNFIKEIIKKRPKEKTLLMDNAGIHHNKQLKKYIQRTKFKLLYNVPYTPEFNPIELLFAKIKRIVRGKNNDENNTQLKNNIEESLKNIPINFFNKIYAKTFSFS